MRVGMGYQKDGTINYLFIYFLLSLYEASLSQLGEIPRSRDNIFHVNTLSRVEKRPTLIFL